MQNNGSNYLYEKSEVFLTKSMRDTGIKYIQKTTVT